MSEFLTYLRIGVQHILDVGGMDHLLFIVSFCLLYSFKDIRKILILVTAFTIGHSITLLLAGFNLISVNLEIIEIIIPITILLSCLMNFADLWKKNRTKTSFIVHYSMILFFGLIHGLGFSNFIKNMLFEGENYLVPILSFNIGIEIVQLCIVFLFYLLLFIVNKLWNNTLWFKVITNAVILGFTCHLILKTTY